MRLRLLWLSLSLLVPRIGFANHAHNASAADDLAVIAATANG